MKHLLVIEWLKLKKYRGFIVVLILFAAGIPGATYIAYSMTRLVSDAMTANIPGGQGVLGSPFDFPNIFHTVAYVGSFMQVLPGLLVVLLMGNEFNYRTHRQNVIDGMGRTDFVLGKVMVIVLIALGAAVMVFLTGCLFGAFGEGAFSLENIKYIGLYLVQSLSYMSVAMLVAVLVRRTGIAVSIYFVYALIAENVLSMLINHNIHSGWGYFLPLRSADKLITAPSFVGRMLNPDLPAQGYLLAAAVAWIVVCLLACRWKFAKTDL